jgi:Cysteine-rich secretory protein family
VGSRYVSGVLGAVMLVCATVFLSAAVEPRKAGASTTAVKTCSGASINLKATEKRAFTLLNKVRKERAHSRQMVEKDYFSHASFTGESVGSRLGRFGYGKSVYGENIAGGYGTPADPGRTFERWMDSAGHRANVLDGRFRRVGVGTYTGNYDGTNGYIMYTVDFGN